MLHKYVPFPPGNQAGIFIRDTLNLKTLAPIGAERSRTEIFIGEKEK